MPAAAPTASAAAPVNDTAEGSASDPAAGEEKSAGVQSSAAPKVRAELTEKELQIVRELASRDREVRAHEQAHASVGGRYAGSPTYDLQRGPDGQQYAVGGEVPIDVGAVPGDPEATITKARIVRRAALAPAQPSPQDRSVAAQATAMEQQARAELAAQRAATRSSSTDGTTSPGDNDKENEDPDALSGYTPIDTRA